MAHQNRRPSTDELKSTLIDPFALLDSMGIGYQTPPSHVTYQTLAAMAEKDTVIGAIINTRVQQVASFCVPQPNKYSIGYAIKPKRDVKKLYPEDIAIAKHIENEILGNDEEDEDFETFIRMVVRDRLIYDQAVSETLFRNNGDFQEAVAVDAATYRIATVRPRSYVQIINGELMAEYTPRELTFSVANPRSNIRCRGYGYSELEMLISTVTCHLWAEEWNKRAFSQGSITKGVLNIKGNISPKQLEAFKKQWISQISGVHNAWKTPILNNRDELQWISLQPTNMEMGYREWMEYLIKIASACYLIDPAEINFDIRGAVGQRPMHMSTNEAQQKLSQDRGLRPLLRLTEKHVNKAIIRHVDPNYKFVIIGLDAKSESEAIELSLKELQSFKTLNEVREAEQLEPVPFGDVIPNPTYIGYRNQQEMMAAQGAQGGEGGAKPPAVEDTEKENKPKEKVPDRFYLPDNEWESTLKASTSRLDEALDDLNKSLSAFSTPKAANESMQQAIDTIEGLYGR